MIFPNTSNNSPISINGPHRETVTGKDIQQQINYSSDLEKRINKSDNDEEQKSYKSNSPKEDHSEE